MRKNCRISGLLKFAKIQTYHPQYSAYSFGWISLKFKHKAQQTVCGFWQVFLQQTKKGAQCDERQCKETTTHLIKLMQEVSSLYSPSAELVKIQRHWIRLIVVAVKGVLFKLFTVFNGSVFKDELEKR